MEKLVKLNAWEMNLDDMEVMFKAPKFNPNEPKYYRGFVTERISESMYKVEVIDDRFCCEQLVDRVGEELMVHHWNIVGKIVMN